MWQSGSNSTGRFVVAGNPGSRRVELFASALAAAGLPPPRVVAWADLLARRADLSDVVRAGDVVRLESPGRDFEVERSILAAGADEPDADDTVRRTYERAARSAVDALKFDRGRILWPRQWYLGFRAVLRLVARQLNACPPHRLLNDVDDVGVMFDKRLCHARLASAGVAVPRALGPVRNFEALTSRMRDAGWRRVFIKLAHESSGSGVVAYQSGGPGGAMRRAVTTVEMVREGGDLRLYNSRRLRTYTDGREIATLIDALARHRVHVEQWVPKAGIDGRTFDLRVVVIAGRARHAIARLSRSPITNLHLLNDRADPAPVRRRMGDDAWHAAMDACERAMACFPRSLHGGVDLLITTDFRCHAVLEVNAFGDLLPGVLSDGLDTFGAEIEAVTGTRPDGVSAPDAAPALEVAT
jgi:hypothetical protein